MPKDQNRSELPPGEFFDNIRAFEALSQTLARQAKDIREAEALSRTNQVLTKRIEEQEQTIKLKEQQIKEKDTANKAYIQGFAEETERGARVKEDLKKEVASAKAKLDKQEATSAEKLNAAARKIQAAQDKEREKDKALKTKEKSLQGVQSQLQESKEQFEALKDGIGMLDLNYNDVFVFRFMFSKYTDSILDRFSSGNWQVSCIILQRFMLA
jgi:chromosome segregation ATPase